MNLAGSMPLCEAWGTWSRLSDVARGLPLGQESLRLGREAPRMVAGHPAGVAGGGIIAADRPSVCVSTSDELGVLANALAAPGRRLVSG